MIGVVANQVEHSVVSEFFELFKTPWEFYRPGTHYDVLLCSNSSVPDKGATLLLLYGSEPQAFEESRNIKTQSAKGCNLLSFGDEHIPIYENCLLFDRPGNEVLVHEETSSLAGSADRTDRTMVRLGFDLFKEISYLLTQGQPAQFARMPALELHVAFLRDLIVSKGLPLLEIPPIPAGYPFTVSLTHDVDHPRVRHHICDHTMFGFLYRALIGSVIELCRGRQSLHQVVANWKAAFSLPFVFAGIVKDFWDQLDHYLELERDLASTFFVITTKGDPGVDSNDRMKAKRASRYALADIAEDLNKLVSANREIAVHGIDAWRDSAKGREEHRRIWAITGATEIGVRMHWLYFNSESPFTLEKSGFSYDSTFGYNETIGYRAGTTQVFRPRGVETLLELPLHIMDTAMFYPSYMNLSRDRAVAAMLPLIENVTRFGGVLTINWHDRSLGPERFWGDAYVALLNTLRARKPWFATANQIVSWFRKRRAISFSRASYSDNRVPVQVAADSSATTDLPPLTVRVYNKRSSQYNGRRSETPAFEDFTIDNSERLLIAA